MFIVSTIGPDKGGNESPFLLQEGVTLVYNDPNLSMGPPNGLQMAPIDPNYPKLPPKWPLKDLPGTVCLWSVPLYIILGDSGHFGSENGVKSAPIWLQ